MLYSSSEWVNWIHCLWIQAVQAQEKAESVWHEPEHQKQPKKLTEPWKEPSQEPQTDPQHTHLHHLKSSPSFKAFTRISFPSSHSKKLKPEESAHRQHLTPYPSFSNAVGNSYSWVAGRSSSSCVSLLSQARPASLAREAVVPSAGEKLSYAAFLEMHPKITVSAT